MSTDASSEAQGRSNEQAQGQSSRQGTALFSSPPAENASEDDGPSSPARRHQPPSSRTVGIEQWADKPQFSDITVRYGDKSERVFHGHKVILASSSIWFQTAFSNPNFAESSAKEITLYDDLPLPVFVMLHSCYRPPNLIYPTLPPWTDAENAAASGTNKIVLYHIDVYAVADKYDVPRLRTVAAAHVIKCLVVYFDLAEKQPKHPKLIPTLNLPELVEKVYKITGAWDEKEPLRKAMLDLIVKHPASKSTGPPGALVSEVLKCARLIESFGRDMYIRTMQDVAKLDKVTWLSTVEQVQCPACNGKWMKPTSWGLARCFGCGVIRQWTDEHVVKRVQG